MFSHSPVPGRPARSSPTVRPSCPVQHQDPIRVAIPFLLLQGPAFLFIPVVSRLLHRVAASWLLTSGFVLIAIGCLLFTQLDVTDPGLGAFLTPALLIGIGFALTVSSVTAVALNSVPQHLAGMASATTNMLRDLGFSLSVPWSSARSPSAMPGRRSRPTCPPQICRPARRQRLTRSPRPEAPSP